MAVGFRFPTLALGSPAAPPPPRNPWPWSQPTARPWSPATPDPNMVDPTPAYPAPAPRVASGGNDNWSNWLGTPSGNGNGGGSGGWTNWLDPAHNGYGDPNQARYDAQGRVLTARIAGLGAQGAYLQSQRDLMGPESAQLDARGRVIAQRTLQNQQQGQYYNLAGQDIGQQQQENARLIAARANVPDMTAVAEQGTANQYADRRDAALGLAPPQEIQAPQGVTGEIAPGVRAAPRTQASYVGEQNQNAQTTRGLNLAMARNALSETGNETEAVSLLADRAGLDLDHAQMLVEQARNNVSAGSLNEDVAAFGEAQAQRPPFAGAVVIPNYDGNGSRWGTQAEAELAHAQFQYGPNGIYTQRLNQGLTSGAATRAATGGLSVAAIQRGLTTLGSDGTPALSEEDARAELEQRGYSEQAINVLIQEARTRRGNSGPQITVPGFGQ